MLLLLTQLALGWTHTHTHTHTHYQLSRKKKDLKFGALGSISDQTFYMCTQNVMNLEKC